MLTIYTPDGTGHSISPSPFVSITHTPLKNKAGTFGCNYSINLTGTIIADQGYPIAYPSQNDIAATLFLPSILKKQNHLRYLFAHDGNRCVISSYPFGSGFMVFYPKLISIDFEAGSYTKSSNYSISLEAPLLFYEANNDLKIYREGLQHNLTTYRYSRDRAVFLDDNTVNINSIGDVLYR